MSLSKTKLIGLAVIIYLVFLLAHFPANQAMRFATLPPQASVKGISGTIWQGYAQEIRFAGTPIFNVSWSLSPWNLLLGQLAIDINGGNMRDSDQVAINGEITLSTSEIGLSDTQLFLPTDIVFAQLPIPMPIDAGGRFKLSVADGGIGVDQTCYRFDANGDWLNASVSAPGRTIELGNFSAKLACQNDQYQITVVPPNTLNLDVIASFSSKGNFSANGKFKVSDTLPQEVHDAAQLFGRQDAQGFYQIQF